MIFVDTGFLIAACQPTDTLHKRAKAWAAALTEPFLVTEYILWETVNWMSAPADRPKAHMTLQYIFMADNWECVPASSELFEAGLQLHAQREDKAWSLTDCISFLVMEQRNIHQALSFDRHFEQAGFEALLRRDP